MDVLPTRAAMLAHARPTFRWPGLAIGDLGRRRSSMANSTLSSVRWLLAHILDSEAVFAELVRVLRLTGTWSPPNIHMASLYLGGVGTAAGPHRRPALMPASRWLASDYLAAALAHGLSIRPVPSRAGTTSRAPKSRGRGCAKGRQLRLRYACLGSLRATATRPENAGGAVIGRLRPALVSIMMVGLLAACGDGGGGGGTDTGGDEPPLVLPVEVPDPCTLVTTAEASAALGKQTGDCKLLGKEQFDASARFLTADGNPGSISITVVAGGRAQYDSVKADAQGKPGFAELSGVGDAAFFQRPFSDAEVVALKGPFVVHVEVGFVDGPPAQEKATTLAKQAVDRITTG